MVGNLILPCIFLVSCGRYLPIIHNFNGWCRSPSCILQYIVIYFSLHCILRAPTYNRYRTFFIHNTKNKYQPLQNWLNKLCAGCYVASTHKIKLIIIILYVGHPVYLQRLLEQSSFFANSVNINSSYFSFFVIWASQCSYDVIKFWSNLSLNVIIK